VNLLKLFLLTVLLGTVGGAFGFAMGSPVVAGGGLVGAFVLGGLFVVGAVYLASRWNWIAPHQRPWSIVGALFGFGLSCMAVLATIMSPIGFVLSSMLMGAGAVMGAIVGVGPHGPDLTGEGRIR
jgi:hypothetical protein